MSIGSKLNVAKTVVTSKAGRQLLKTQKNSPAILFGAGVIGVVATTVMASKATLKLGDVLEEHEKNVERASEARELGILGRANYSEKDQKKDLAILKATLIKDCARLYAPAVVVGTLSVAALTGSHVILTRRNTALMAAYATLDQGFKEYRARVTERYGEDIDRELKFGSKEIEVAVDDDKGRTTIETVKIASGPSQYARFFGPDTSKTWSPQPEYNLVTLRAIQKWANDRLQTRGHVLLNDVYDDLGMERTKAGCVVGWVKGHGDNYIDFGIFDDDNREQFADFMTGREKCILLDFNVDGVVYDLI